MERRWRSFPRLGGGGVCNIFKQSVSKWSIRSDSNARSLSSSGWLTETKWDGKLETDRAMGARARENRCKLISILCKIGLEKRHRTIQLVCSHSALPLTLFVCTQARHTHPHTHTEWNGRKICYWHFPKFIKLQYKSHCDCDNDLWTGDSTFYK